MKKKDKNDGMDASWEEGTKKSGGVLIALYVLLGILLLGLGVGGFLFVRQKAERENYEKQIKSAKAYLEAEDYENAILVYQEAIADNPKDDEAYLALADVYLEQEKTSEARVLLRSGFIKTGSRKIEYMLESLTSAKSMMREQENRESKTENVQIEQASEGIQWNDSLMQKLVNYTYSDFTREFGRSNISKNADGELEVVHNTLNGTLFYRNTDTNREIIDPSGRRPDNAGMPEKVHLDSLDILFRNFDGRVSRERLEMMIGQRVSVKKMDKMPFIEFETYDCLFRIETDERGNIIKADAWNEIELMNANQKEREGEQFSGIVLNAINVKGVPGAKLLFTPDGKSEREGAVSVEAETGEDGSFSVELLPGTYQLEIKAEGYTPEKFEVTIKENETHSGEQFIISPKLAEGQARIVLEWGASPSDLDSYLDGEDAAGGDVHVSYRRKIAYQANTAPAQKAAELDVDVTSGFGPETVTIHDLGGSYTYTVRDFRMTGTMARSGATVKVYLPGESTPTVIQIDGSVVNVWTVFKIENGKISILNKAGE